MPVANGRAAMVCRLFSSLGVLLCASVLATVAEAQQPIRLRERSFVPPANVSAPMATQRRLRSVARVDAEPRHYLLQFEGAISPATYDAVRAAGAVPLRFVPENALTIAAPAGFSATSIPGARWLGELQPGDKVSAETSADLAAPFPARPLTVIEFHPDVSRSRAARVLAEAAASEGERRNLPPHIAIIHTDAAVIARVAADDAVAWVYPASLPVEWAPAALCEGLVRPEGLVASFAATGDGWDGPGRGAVALTYFLQQPSSDLPALVQREALQRAMDEWSRHAAVTWSEATRGGMERSVTILWGGLSHGDPYPFRAWELAHAYYPAPHHPEAIAGDVHFNDTVAWGLNDLSRWDVFSVAVHELGHSLGLAHSADPEAVMYPLYRGIVSGAGEADIRAIQSIYAAPSPPPTLPGAWGHAAIGIGASGTAYEADGRFTLTSSGQDIWGTADGFTFVSRPLSGSGDIVARVDALSATHRWAKAGVMIRGSAEDDAAHGFALVSRARGAAFQRRPLPGGASLHTNGPDAAAPYWLWLSRRGNRVQAYGAWEGGAWTLLGADTISLPHTAAIGLALTNHGDETDASAAFSNVAVTALAEGPWSSGDIGDVGRAGAAEIAGATIRVRGAGADVWDRADAFHFVYQPIQGDVDVTARLSSVQHVRAWSKAGVMIRAGSDPGAEHGFLLGSAGKGFAFQRRTTAGGLSAHSAAGMGPAPGWLRLSRRGQRLNAYRSDDGLRWTLVGSEPIRMGREVLVGVAVSSHTRTAVAQAVFDQVTITRPLR